MLLFLGFALFGCVTSAPKKTFEPANNTIEPPPLEENKTAAQEPAEEISPCAYAKNVLESDKCFLALSKSESSILRCSEIYSIPVRDECILPFAIKEPKLCEQLVNPSTKQDCYESAAIYANNSSYCARISNQTKKRSCYEQTSPPCTYEESEKATQLCLALEHNDTSYCTDSTCYFEVGTTYSNLEACEKIGDNERALRLACKAIASNNISACTGLGIDTITDYCYQLAAYSQDNPSWCSLATKGSAYSNDCFVHFAIERNDPIYCKYGSPETMRDNCYVDYSAATGNYSACEKIYVSTLMVECYFKTAKNHGDLSSCNKLNYQSRASCYNQVLYGGIPIKSLQSCDVIIDVDPWQYRCYTEYAWQNNDISACNLINSTKYAADCRFRLE